MRLTADVFKMQKGNNALLLHYVYRWVLKDLFLGQLPTLFSILDVYMSIYNSNVSQVTCKPKGSYNLPGFSYSLWISFLGIRTLFLRITGMLIENVYFE
jgi:hypothetical protein